MSRARNIKPGFYKNEDLAECSIWARYIFPGLWMLADREGRLEDRPKRIKGELLPFDAADVDPLLHELHDRGFIRRYEVSGVRYIHVLKFLDHQAPHYSEKESLIPAPFREPTPHDEGAIPGNTQSSEHQNPPETGQNRPPDESSCHSDSGNQSGIKGTPKPPDSLIPDSLNPESLSLTPPGEVGGKGAAARGDWPGFLDFYSPYPKKEARPKALQAWNKLRPNAALAARIIADVTKRAGSFDWQKDGGRYVPQPATYLNQRRWEDQPASAPAAAPPPQTNGQHAPPPVVGERARSQAEIAALVGE